MTVENDQKIKAHPTLDGITNLAKCEMKFIERLEKEKGEDYKLNTARLIIDLERITNVAEEYKLELPENLVLTIYDLMATHPDRKEIIKIKRRSF